MAQKGASSRSRKNRTVEAPIPPTFHIVGVGASAGGLEAFTTLLTHLPLDTGMAFVLVQHLDPDHESALTQILARATKLPVHEVVQDQLVEPNHIYIIPPNTFLTIESGLLKLDPRLAGRAPHRSVDHFFESLAQYARERAIGVVLSGAANDGTLGLEAIRAEGGFTFAQDATAKYDSMPRSAIAAGCVDLVLPPERIAEELAWIAHHPHAAESGALLLHVESNPEQVERDRLDAVQQSAADDSAANDKVDARFRKILVLLHNHSGVDFSLYKSSTIHRRINRRIVLSRVDSFDGYVNFLRGNNKELDALYADVLINVTDFFRNPESFEYLKRSVLPTIMPEGRSDPLRVWVLGCSTGQEAYSLAMIVAEYAKASSRPPRLQVFATDLNEALLEKARAGLYSKSVVNDVSAERLKRFFVEEDGGYRVIKSLRESVVFARQNLLTDPPFSRLDLVSCRNLLIYIEGGLQKKVMPMFHYALRPNGCLFLGASESVGSFTDLFEPLDRRHKLFRRKAGQTALQTRLTPGHPNRGQDGDAAIPEREPEGFRAEVNAQREADRVTRNRYAPPSVLINGEMRVLEFRGNTDPYLRAPTGQATFELLKMAREGLMLPLRSAINKARKDGLSVRKENIKVAAADRAFTAHLEVVPLKNVKEPSFLVFFEAAAAPASDADGRTATVPTPATRARAASGNAAKEQTRRIAELESTLAETRDYAQSILEQHEAAHEELQASSEEVTSANEELQSINEELETSKEELESANEELTTINDEMATRNSELNRLNSDLSNLQTSTNQAIVLLDRDLSIRRFSQPAERLLNMDASDIGRSFASIRHDLVIASDRVKRGQLPTLESLIAQVIGDLLEREVEVQDRNGCWFSLRVRPYLSLDNRVDGVVLVLINIDALKQSAHAVAAARDDAEAIVRTSPEAMAILDGDLRVQSANEAFYDTFRTTSDATVGNLLYELSGGEWNIPLLRARLEQVLRDEQRVDNLTMDLDFASIGSRIMVLNARQLRDAAEGQPRIILGFRDVTVTERAERTAAHLAAIVTSSDDAILSKDLDGIIQTWNRGAQALFGYTEAEAVGQPGTLIIPPDRADEEASILTRLRAGETVAHFETVRRHKDGTLKDISLNISPILNAAGEITGVAKTARDITDRRKVDQALRDSEQQYRQLTEELRTNDRRKNEFLAMLAHELRNPLAPLRTGLEVLDRMDGPDPARLPVRSMMQRQVQQLVRLVDDLLDVSRVSSGKITLRHELVDLRSVLQNAVEAVRPTSEARNQQVAVQVPDSNLLVNGDPVRLMQVFGNLLNNASKFSEPGARIELNAFVDQGNVQVEVRDEGVGVSAEDLPRIFDLFTQVDSSLERSTSGLGLGLTLVQALVKLHGGSVTARSEGLGCGTTLAVRLPLIEVGLVDVPAPPTSGEAITPIGRKVLVIDDNRDAAILSPFS